MMNSQQLADHLLRHWQQQRAAGIPPEQRQLDSAFERDLDIIRRAIERHE